MSIRCCRIWGIVIGGLLLAACGQRARQASARPADVAFIVENSGQPGAEWRAPVLPSAADTAALSAVRTALVGAVTVSGVPTMSCGVSGLMVIIPPPMSGATSWEIGLSGGSVLRVSSDVLTCDGSGQQSGAENTIAVNYADIDGRVEKAPGLIGDLSSLSQDQPTVTALAVSPNSLAAEQPLQVTGSGWVGSRVTLGVSWCASTGSNCRAASLGSAPVDGGHISWAGSLPSTVPPNATDLTFSGANSLRSIGGVELPMADVSP